MIVGHSLSTPSVALLSAPRAGAAINVPASTLALLLDTANLQHSVGTACWDWLERSVAYDLDRYSESAAGEQKDRGSDELHRAGGRTVI